MNNPKCAHVDVSFDAREDLYFCEDCKMTFEEDPHDFEPEDFGDEEDDGFDDDDGYAYIPDNDDPLDDL